MSIPIGPNAPTEIANLTADILKVESIQDIEMATGDPIAEVFGRWWQVSKGAALEGFPWNFASLRAVIPLVSPAPLFGYTDAYRLPVDFVSLNFIKEDHLPLSQWDYTIEGQNILMNNCGSPSLNIGYVFNSDDIAKWTSAFKLYVAYQLAYFCVFKLTGQTATVSRIKSEMPAIRMQAKAVNGILNPPKAYRESLMSKARRRFGRNRLSS